MSNKQADAQDDPLFSGDFALRTRQALRVALRVLLAIAVAALAVALLISRPIEVAAVTCLLAGVLGLNVLEHYGRVRGAIHGMVGVLIAYGLAGLATYGSIRGTASLAFIGAIVMGGIFLGRLGLIGAVALCAAAQGALIYAERAGWLPLPDHRVGLAQWVLNVLFLAALAVNIHYSRGIVLGALARSKHDLHERVRAEHALGEAEDLFGALFGSNPAALMITEMEEGRVVDLNAAHALTFGWQREEAIGRTTIELDCWEDMADRAAFRNEMRLRPRIRNYPCRFKRRNGEIFDALISAEVMDWRGAKHMFSAVTDISGELALRNEVQRSENRFALVFRQSPMPIVITNFDTATIVDVNAEAEQLLGRSRAELMGQHTRMLFADPAAQDQIRGRAAAQGIVRRMPLRIIRPADGDMRHLMVSSGLVTDDGVRYAIVMAIDVTPETQARAAEERSQQRFETIFRESPVGVIFTNYDSAAIIDANAAATEALGISKEELIGRGARSLYIDPAQHEQLRAELDRSGHVHNLPVRLRHGDGSIRDILASVARFSEDGVRYAISMIVDVTAEKRTREALARSEQRFETIFRASPVGMIITDFDKKTIIDANAAAASAFGFGEGNFAYQDMRDAYTDPAQQDRLRADLIRSGHVHNMPMHLRSGDGGKGELLVSATLFDEGGVRYGISMIVDVTAQTRAREALSRSEQRFETIFRDSPVGMLITDFDKSAIVDINAAARRLFGVTQDELLTGSVGSLYVDQGQYLAVRAELEQCGQISNRPVRLRGSGGSVRDLLLSTVVFSEEEKRFSVSMLVDVTAEVRAREALEESELRFATAFNFIPIGMTITRVADGRIVEVNQADERTLGYTRGETIGRTTIETGGWASKEDRERFIDLLRRDGRVMGYDTRMRNKAGEIIDARIFAERIDFGGEPCVLAATLNVTDEKRSAAEIRALNEGLEARVRQRTAEIEKANADLAAANKDLEAFAYSVSHDLRAPLRWINGYASMLEVDHAPAMPEEARRVLERIQAAAARMDGIIDDMLRLSNAIRAELHPRVIDVSAMATQIAAQVGSADPRRHVDWRIPPGLTAVADTGMLRLVLENLLGNAWKYSSKTAAPVIEVSCVADHRDSIEFCVRDNGAGFDMAYASRLFIPFRRLHTQDEFPGNGIGLATVHRILQRHGGRIRAEAVPGAGAAFFFTLPNIAPIGAAPGIRR